MDTREQGYVRGECRESEDGIGREGDCEGGKVLAGARNVEEVEDVEEEIVEVEVKEGDAAGGEDGWRK